MKTVTLYRPSFESTLHDLDQWPFFGDIPLMPASRLFNQPYPALNLRETETAYLLDAELPGYDEKTIEVHVDGNQLTIESKQTDAALEDADEKYLIQERRRRSFSRVFKLPENADSSAISAVFKNGVLCLEIRKQASTPKRVIPING
jgi:HSP20 family protein